MAVMTPKRDCLCVCLIFSNHWIRSSTRQSPKKWIWSSLRGVLVQVIALPWISRSAFMADYEFSGDELDKVFNKMEDRVTDRIKELINQADKSLPLILTAHVSIQGAQYGSERMVMLGSDMVVSGSLVKDPR